MKTHLTLINKPFRVNFGFFVVVVVIFFVCLFNWLILFLRWSHYVEAHDDPEFTSLPLSPPTSSDTQFLVYVYFCSCLWEWVDFTGKLLKRWLTRPGARMPTQGRGNGPHWTMLCHWHQEVEMDANAYPWVLPYYLCYCKHYPNSLRVEMQAIHNATVYTEVFKR